jgi:hypothetical protein
MHPLVTYDESHQSIYQLQPWHEPAVANVSTTDQTYPKRSHAQNKNQHHPKEKEKEKEKLKANLH